LHSAAIAMGEMGGTIRVVSSGIGQGATFTITLPLQFDTATESAAPKEPSAALASIS